MTLRDLQNVTNIKENVWLEDKRHIDISNSRNNSDFDAVWDYYLDTEIVWIEIGDKFMAITLDCIKG